MSTGSAAGELVQLVGEIGALHLALLAAVAFVAATVSGMSGFGGALLMAIFIAPIVGVKAVVPTVGVATLIAHVVRVWVYRRHLVWRPALMMLAGCTRPYEKRNGTLPRANLSSLRALSSPRRMQSRCFALRWSELYVPAH